MRKTQKTTAVVGGTIAAVLVGGVAFAYWTTSGSGGGSADTTGGNNAAVAITGDGPTGVNAMYPGDSPQTFTATVKNTDANQSVYVTGVTAYLTVTQTPAGTAAGPCNETDYSLSGQTDADATHPVALTLASPGAVELGAAGSASDTTTATGTLQFHDKTVNQDGCKGATVHLHYASN